MNKSFSKRIKMSARGLVIRRASGVNHFKTRKNQKSIRDKRKMLSLNFPTKSLKEYANR